MTKEGFVGANFVLTARMATNRKMWSDENFGRDNEKRRVILDELSRICCIDKIALSLGGMAIIRFYFTSFSPLDCYVSYLVNNPSDQPL